MSARTFIVVVLVILGGAVGLALWQTVAPIADVVIERESSTADRPDRPVGLPPVGSAAGTPPISGARRGPVPANATVVRVVDGDTIVVTINTFDTQSDRSTRRDEHTVRLLGIDTPETHKPATPVECYGPEAAALTLALLPPGTPVRLSLDTEARDRYGRLLAHVERARDGLTVNLALVQAGAAASLSIAPNFVLADALADAASQARAAGRGLWGQCAGPHAPREAPAP